MLNVSKAAAASATAACACAASWTRPIARSFVSSKLCTPIDKPGHAGRAKGAEAIALEGARIGFERDLAAGFERQPRADVGQQPIDRFGREEARRAAADEDAVDAPAPDERQRGFEVGAQRVQVARLGQRVHIGFG